MFDQYLEQLASSDTSQRRQAIIGLGKLGDSRALPPLASVYKNDPDPALRELALKAGRYLKGATTSAPVAEPAYVPSSAQTMMSYAAEPAATVAVLPPKEVSYLERQKAKSRVDYAMGLVAEGRNDKALAELADAIRINPELVNDQVVINLASSVTGIYTTTEAMNALVEKAGSLDKKMKKRKDAIKPQEENFTPHADNTAIVLMITLLVMFVVTAIMTVLGRLALIHQLDSLDTAFMLTRSQSQAFRQAAASMRVLPPFELFIGSGFQIIGTLIFVAIVFGVGTLFGGTGTFVRFLNQVLRVRLIMSIVIFVEISIWYFIVTRSGDPAPVIQDSLVNLVGIVSLTYFVDLFWESVAVARGHNIGIPSGCLTMFLGFVVYLVGIFVLAFILTSVLRGAS